VVRLAVISTTNITGFLAICRGSSFLKALPMAGHRIAGSITLF
jgi:predicted permease